MSRLPPCTMALRVPMSPGEVSASLPMADRLAPVRSMPPAVKLKSLPAAPTPDSVMKPAVSVRLPGRLSVPSAPTPAMKRPEPPSPPMAVAFTSPPASTEPLLFSVVPARVAAPAAETTPAFCSAPPARRSMAAPPCTRLSAVAVRLRTALMFRLPACVATMPPSVASVPAVSVMPCSAAIEPSACSAPPAVAASVLPACRFDAAPSARSPRTVFSVRSPCNAATVPSTVIPSPALIVCETPASMRPAASSVPCAAAVSVSAACASPVAPTAMLRPVKVSVVSLAAVPSTRASRAAASTMSCTDASAPAALRSRTACAVSVPAACTCPFCLTVRSRPADTSRLPADVSPSAAAVPPRRASPAAVSVRPPPATMTPSESRSAPAAADRFCEACMRPLELTRNCPPASAVRPPDSAATVPSMLRWRVAARLAGEPAVTTPVTNRSRAAWACRKPPAPCAVLAVPAVPAMRRSCPASRISLPLPCASPAWPMVRSAPA
ncbi:hypothetical protein D3C86_1084470 [compost metagenome]